jgi:hypothetical protein
LDEEYALNRVSFFPARERGVVGIASGNPSRLPPHEIALFMLRFLPASTLIFALTAAWLYMQKHGVTECQNVEKNSGLMRFLSVKTSKTLEDDVTMKLKAVWIASRVPVRHVNHCWMILNCAETSR